MQDDPFAELGEAAGAADVTVMLPKPGSDRASRLPTGTPRAMPRETAPVPTVGANALVAAAAPLLAAATRIGASRSTGTRAQAPNPDQLYRTMVDGVRDFETQGLATGLDTRSLRAARYALCATIDDMVLSTPWGSGSAWVTRSLTSTFHNEVTGGERFFSILEELQKDPGRHAEVIELMYLCISLGFEGRYRVLGRGTAALTELRDSVYRGVRQRRGEFERELSPQWRGIRTDGKPLSRRVPLWLVGLGTVAAACTIYLVFNFSLAGASDIAFGQFTALPPHGPVKIARSEAAPPPPPVPAAAATPAAHAFLQPEVAAGLVQVLEDPQSITVRLTNKAMFASGSATLNPDALPLLRRIGKALAGEPGGVQVDGYTDNQPIRTVRFPSNWQLSQARADAVAAVLAAELPAGRTIKAMGKGDGDPLASNATPEGREQNRRTEIVLSKTATVP